MEYAKHKITMSDIAARLGISKNSVSLALNNKPGVSDDLRNKIIMAAEEMNYPGHMVKGITRNRCILLVSADYLRNDAFFYSDIFWSIEKEAKAIGCIAINISISPQAEREGILPDLPTEMEIVGILAIGIFKYDFVKRLQSYRLPMLTVDIIYYNLHVGGISTANLEGGYTAAEYLLQCGHKEIGFIGPMYTAQSVYERYCGFRQAMDTARVPVRDEYNITGKPGSFELFDTVEALAPYFSKIDKYPTAWFCAGDRIAAALMNQLSRKGVKIPEDISIIGFDDIPLAQMVYPQLTTIKVDRELMGALAVEGLINWKTRPGTLFTSLSGTLVVRDSVKRR